MELLLEPVAKRVLFMEKLDLSGQRFGKLLVVREIKIRGKHQRIRWLCKCDCGKTTIKYRGYLRNGDTKSCGCNKFWIAHNQNGDKHWSWQGDDTSYTNLHAWLSKQYGKPVLCEKCGIKGRKAKYWTIQWALIKGKRYIRKRENFWGLCVSCHHKYDSIGFKKGNQWGKLSWKGRE